jgi:hypothetical protein
MIKTIAVAIGLALSVVGTQGGAQAAPPQVTTFFTHSGVMVAGPGPYVRIQMRSYIACTGDPNPLHEPCERPYTSASIHITAKLARLQRCIDCERYTVVSSNDPLVYPVGKPLVIGVDYRHQGVAYVSFYRHYVLSYTAAGDIVIHRQDGFGGDTPFCSRQYLQTHPGAYAAEGDPCGA